MAEFCVAMKMTPDEYRKLSLLEYQELIGAFARSKGSNELQELI